jgi:hypothetical protein
VPEIGPQPALGELRYGFFGADLILCAMPSRRGYLRRGPTPDHRWALDLLASCPDACTEALLLANSLSVESPGRTDPRRAGER